MTGDQVLRLVAMSVKQNVKGQDTAVRNGNEEFATILPYTVVRSAIAVANHIRRAVMTKELIIRSTGEYFGWVTISVAGATLHKNDTAQKLIKHTESCLFAAKRHSRSRMIYVTDPEVATAEQAMQVARTALPSRRHTPASLLGPDFLDACAAQVGLRRSLPLRDGQ